MSPTPIPRRVHLPADDARTEAIALKLHRAFRESPGGIFGEVDMPENLLPIGVSRGSPEHLTFLTLTVAIDYQRDANALWDAGRKTMADPAVAWLYRPEGVAGAPFETIMDALKRHRLSKKHSQDAWIWQSVARTLFRDYGGSVEVLLDAHGHDAARLHKALSRGLKKDFPFLSGPKILPLWIRMLRDAGGVQLTNVADVPIPVDVHVARATFTLGVLAGEVGGTISHLARAIDDAWRTGTERSGLHRLQLDEPLWHLSRLGCKHRGEAIEPEGCPRFSGCPVATFCVPGRIRVGPGGVFVQTSRPPAPG